MCLYCKTLAELRRKDLEAYSTLRKKYHSWIKQEDMLLRRCLIALEWKGNEELVDDILKLIDEGGEVKC